MLPTCTYITIRYSAVVSAHLKQLFSDHRPLAYLKHEVLFKIPHVKVIRSFRLIYPQFAYGCWFDHNHTDCLFPSTYEVHFKDKLLFLKFINYIPS